MKKKCGFGIATGILSVIFGIFVLAFDGGGYSFYDYSGIYTSHKSYGGDAYTGIQNAAADTASNVNELIELVEQAAFDTGRNINDLIEVFKLGFGFLLMIIGLLIIMYFWVQNSKCAEGQTVVHSQNGTVTGGNVGRCVEEDYRAIFSQLVAGRGETSVSSNYWTCEKCGERNPKTKMFCRSCGEPK